MQYCYRCYGLNIRSEIEFPELIQCETDRSDVVIVRHEMPADIIERKAAGHFRFGDPYQSNWFYMQEVGDLYVHGGGEIWLAAEKNANELLIRSMILGACFGLILLQREVLAIHGSCLAKNGRAIAISGDSGAGKTTITAGLLERGCRFLADDTVVVQAISDELLAVPAYPQQKLCRDMAIHFGFELSELTRLHDEREKYAVNRRTLFTEEPVRLTKLFVLKCDDVSEVQVDRRQGREALDELFANLYFADIYRAAGVHPVFMMQALNFVKRVEVYVITRPRSGNSVEQVMECIEAMM